MLIEVGAPNVGVAVGGDDELDAVVKFANADTCGVVFVSDDLKNGELSFLAPPPNAPNPSDG